MKQIYFVRHGETAYNKRHIVQGSGIDSALNEKGQKQAEAFFDYYKNIPFDIVYTSKLIRTHQTVKGFIDKGTRWEQWAELNEIGWGVHEGKQATPAMKANYQRLIKEWGKGNFDAKLENGESARQLSDRVTDFLEHIKTSPEQTILVCTHGRTMRCIISQLKREHLREMEKYMHYNTGVYLAHYQPGKFTIIEKNDISHL